MRFFLQARLGSKLIADGEGAGFVDLYEAIAEAEQAARELAINELRGGGVLSPDWSIEITNEFGYVHESVSFETLIAAQPPPSPASEPMSDHPSGTRSF